MFDDMDESGLPSAYGQSWFAATMVDAPARPLLAADLDVDVCVIGGGLAGLTTTLELARAGWSVVLLEAGRLAAGASGRNTGFVLPGFAAGPDSIISRVGFERAKDLWALSQSGLEYVRNAIRDDVMVRIGAQEGWLHVSKTDNGDELTHLAGLLGEFGADIEGWPTEQVRSVLRSERYFHALHYPRAINVHPINYALGLAAAAERAGARIFEQTPATSIDPAGVRKRIVTPQARLRANQVVLCGNMQVAELMPQVAATLIPITHYVIATASLGPRLAEVVGYRGAVSDTDLADNHYRIVDGDRLVWSGRVTARPRDPRRYARALVADIRKTYPQLGEVTADYAWSGTMGHSIHRMPQIGELGPGVWLASGFGGHGLNTTAMAGNLIARAIAHGDQAWRQFTPFELVWAGGVFGRAMTQVSYWTMRLRAAVAERRAQAAEASHRRRQIAAAETDDASVSARGGNSPATDDRAIAGALPAKNESAPSAADLPPPITAAARRRRRRNRPEGAEAPS
jgi:glycine/D-amino acid oxidase-like deaminating enzyme